MGDGFGGLLFGEPVIHRAIEMVGDLLDLAAGDQRSNRDQAAIARRKVRAQPQVAEQIVRRVLHETRCDSAELVSDARRAVGLGLLVERQGLGVDLRELVRADIAPGEDVANGADGGHRLAPAGIIGEMRDGLRDLGGLHAVLKRLIGIVGERTGLAARDERRDRDEAAIARVQARPLPDVAVKAVLRVVLERRRGRVASTRNRFKPLLTDKDAALLTDLKYTISRRKRFGDRIPKRGKLRFPGRVSRRIGSESQEYVPPASSFADVPDAPSWSHCRTEPAC